MVPVSVALAAGGHELFLLLSLSHLFQTSFIFFTKPLSTRGSLEHHLQPTDVAQVPLGWHIHKHHFQMFLPPVPGA